jgi:hypothetical protein
MAIGDLHTKATSPATSPVAGKFIWGDGVSGVNRSDTKHCKGRSPDLSAFQRHSCFPLMRSLARNSGPFPSRHYNFWLACPIRQAHRVDSPAEKHPSLRCHVLARHRPSCRRDHRERTTVTAVLIWPAYVRRQAQGQGGEPAHVAGLGPTLPKPLDVESDRLTNAPEQSA